MFKKILLGLCVLPILAGCSSVSQASSTNTPINNGPEHFSSYKPSEAQQKAIADNEITREEYDAGFRKFEACMEKGGNALAGVEFINSVYEYSYGADKDPKIEAKCYGTNFAKIDMLWQTRPEVEEQSETSRADKWCLRKHGIEPAKTMAERQNQMINKNIDTMKCYEEYTPSKQ